MVTKSLIRALEESTLALARNLTLMVSPQLILRFYVCLNNDNLFNPIVNPHTNHSLISILT